MLLRLWQAERPRAVVVGWDTLEVPTYRHRELAGYQAGRVFDAALLEQLDRLPKLVAATGIVNGKAPGTRPTTSWPLPSPPSGPQADGARRPDRDCSSSPRQTSRSSSRYEA